MNKSDHFGLVALAPDVHLLGITSVAQLLAECGYRTVIADTLVREAFSQPEIQKNWRIVEQWLTNHHITALGLSYRLDPEEGEALFARVITALKRHRFLKKEGGKIATIYFAGLPKTCELVRRRHPIVTGTFCGDETPVETLQILGVSPRLLPQEIAKGIGYDEDRLSFGKNLVRKGEYLKLRPIDRGGYSGFGTAADSLEKRLTYVHRRGELPLFRAHLGPYLPDRNQAVRLFLEWTKDLANTGFLDILSIGTSQLTQSAFEEDWTGRTNGGGVPLNSKAEFAAVWQAARPMLVRTYAGTKNILALARMYEETIHIAWHALSLWWFCSIDGRGPYTLKENLEEQIKTLRYVGTIGKPYEPNVAHHFAFRGADDVTYIVSAVLAARLAKLLGIRLLILQNMLNTPKSTWGIQDLAKARALLKLIRELEDTNFRVLLQPRAGLDYFSTDLNKARAQLAAVTALMDDIEPFNPASPPIVHVVGYSEASQLADPLVVNESIQITRHALVEWRRLRQRGEIDDMNKDPEVQNRTATLINEARIVLNTIESTIPKLYTPEGFYSVFAQGFLPVPNLWAGREEFPKAVRWQTRFLRGGVVVVSEENKPISALERMRLIAQEKG